MTDLSLDLKNSIADLQTRHAALITAVQTYRTGSVNASKAEISAAIAALEARLAIEESTLLGLAGRGVQPSLCLDFTKDMYLMGENRLVKGYSFANLVTFTRTSTGTSFNSAGNIISNAINAPRFDYDPATKTLRGLLIEEGRTNMATNSEAIGSWAKSRATVTPNAGTSPDGLNNAFKLVNNTVADWHFIISSSITAITGGLVSASIFAKAGENTRVRIASGNNNVFSRSAVFDLATGTVITGGAAATMQSVGNGWWRCNLALLGIADGSAFYTIGSVKAGEVESNSAGDDISGIYIWGGQAEAGAFPTSYIPTTTTQVTRTGDTANVTALSPWFNAAEGTLFVDVEPAYTGATNWYASFTDDTLNNVIDIGIGVGGKMRGRVLAGAATQALLDSVAVATKLNKAVIAYRKDNIGFSSNGAAAVVDVLGEIPSGITRLGIGRISTYQYSPGYIRSLRYYPRRLTDAQLQAMTA